MSPPPIPPPLPEPSQPKSPTSFDAHLSAPLRKSRAPPDPSPNFRLFLNPFQLRRFSGGACEPIVGACLKALRAAEPPGGPKDAATLRVTTKAHPSQPGGLSPLGLERQLEASLDALGVDTVCGRGEDTGHPWTPTNPLP